MDVKRHAGVCSIVNGSSFLASGAPMMLGVAGPSPDFSHQSQASGEVSVSLDRSYDEQNTRERERMRVLVLRLSDDELRSPVNEYWTVAGVLGHIAFWDARVLALADKLERGVPFSPSDTEPEDVDWINDATRPLIHAIEPRELAQLALRLAEETDQRVASLPPDRMFPQDPDSPVNHLRADHRGEHLDDIDAALRDRGGSSSRDG